MNSELEKKGFSRIAQEFSFSETPYSLFLLRLITEAQQMKPQLKSLHEEKEPYGPGCRDYFWLLCILIENMDKVSLCTNVQMFTL